MQALRMFPFSIALAVSLAGDLSSRAVAAAASDASLVPDAGRGRTVYELHCAACHGTNGDGGGSASVWLFPRPRNFSAGLFKIKSTPGTALPTDEDLLRTVTRGMPGSSMPSFTYLSERERQDAVAYVKQLTAYSDATGRRINRFEEAERAGAVASPVAVPPEPPVTVQALADGGRLFTKLLCNTCHGDTGAGDGPNAPTLKDTQGLYLPPRDFNTGAFRGGHTGRDLYLRIATGLAGTPMVAFGPDVLSEQERWSLVHFIQSLRRKDVEISDMLAPADDLIHVTRVSRLPVDPADPAWEGMDPARILLNPLWPEKDIIYAVAIRAVHDGERLAVLCTWKDPVADGAPIRVQDFQDAVALQFPLNGVTPFLGMGDAKNPVNIWQWKAGWQQETEDPRPDMPDRYVSMHVDTYFATSYRTATDCGNPLAVPHASPVEDANAYGFGTIKSQPPASQNVNGKGVWRDSAWNVVFLRALKSKDADDVQFAIGKATPVAFAVWDGQNRDRNGRKVVSNWRKLVLEP